MKQPLLKIFALAALMTPSALAVTNLQYATWDGTRQKTDEALIASFNKSHPEIKVDYNLVPWGVYWQKAAAMTAGGSTFDVMWMNLDNFPFYASQGALAPITIGDSSIAGINKTRLNPYRVGSKLYGVPLGPQAVTVYINRALFKERGVTIPTQGWTFDEMLVAAKKLTFEKGGKKYWGINGSDLEIDSEYGMSFYYSAGGTGIIKKTASGYVPNLDATFQTTAQKLLDLIYKDKVAPGPTEVAQQGYQMFLAGQLGIYVLGSWMTSVWPQNPDLDWAFAPFPNMTASKPRPVFSAHALVVPAASKNKEAAQTLIEWLTTAAPSQRTLAQRSLLPTLAEQFQSLFLQSLPGRNAQTVVSQLGNSVINNADVRNLNNLPEVLNELYKNMNLAWTNNATLADSLKKATEGMTNVLKQSKPFDTK
jgi:multiple sugar transport system substrate-binding protein